MKTYRLALIVFCSMVLCSMVGLGAAGLAGAQQSALTLRVATVSPVEGQLYQAAQVFATDLKKRVGESRVNITIYPTGVLGNYNEELTQIHSGANVLEALFDSLGDVGPWNKLAGLEAVPYIYKDEAHFFRVWRGPLGAQIIETVAAQSGFRLVGPGFRGFRVMSINRPVRKVEDLSGLKLRVPAIPAYIAAWKALGANPTPIPFEDTFTAIQQHVVDGLENPVSVMWDNSMYSVTKYLIITNHMAETMGYMFNEKWYQALDPDMRKAIGEAAATSSDWLHADTDKSTQDYITKLKAKGMTVIYPDLSGFVARGKNADLDPVLVPWANRIRATP